MNKRILFTSMAVLCCMTPLCVYAENDPVVVEINEETFPDKNFRDELEQSKQGFDGVLTLSEIENFKTIYIKKNEIKSIAGIEHLSNLEKIVISTSGPSEVDLSKNPKLKEVIIKGENNIEKINLGVLPQLTDLTVRECKKITDLDLSGCKNLSSVDCRGNDLTSLDISQNPELTSFRISANKLKSIDISSNVKLQELDCWNNPELCNIDVSHNPELTFLRCDNCQLDTLDISQNHKLVQLACDQNNLSEIDVSNALELSYLEISNNPITELDVSKNMKLDNLGCRGTNITDLDLSIQPIRHLSLDDSIHLRNVLINPETILVGISLTNSQVCFLNLPVDTSFAAGALFENNQREVLDGTPLTELNGFDVSKVTNLTGGSLENGIIRFDEGSDTIQYEYDRRDADCFYSLKKADIVSSWVQMKNGWMYSDADKRAVTDTWKEINGSWYYFDHVGWMATGWKQIGGSWYYFNESGAMVTGWKELGGAWYYFNGSGAMVTDWKELGGVWYYFNGSGAMATGWRELGGVWYYFNGSGAMATGWKELGGVWYYFNGSGAMATGWKELGGVWYYFDGSGAMAANQWIGNCWVNESGAWV